MYPSKSTNSIVYRENNKDIEIDQGNWNIDMLEGNGQSRYTFDPSKQTTFYFNWKPSSSAKGRGFMEIGIFSDEKYIPCQIFGKQESLSYFQSPLRWEISSNQNIPSSKTLSHGKGQIYYDAIYIEAIPTNFLPPREPKYLSQQQGNLSLFSLRLKEQFNRSDFIPKTLSLANVLNSFVKWELRINANVPNESFNLMSDYLSANEESQLLVSINESKTDNVSGGKIVASGILAAGQVKEVDLLKSNLVLSSNILGEPQTLTLCVKLFNNDNNTDTEVSASMEWYEVC